MKYPFKSLSAFCNYALRQRQFAVPSAIFCPASVEAFSTYNKTETHWITGKLHHQNRAFTSNTKPRHKTVENKKLITRFQNLTGYRRANVKDLPSECSNLMKNCIKKIPDFRDEELADVMKCLCKVRTEKRIGANFDDQLFLKVMERLDEECRKRVQNWDLKKNLYMLGIFRTCKFNSNTHFGYETFRRRHQSIYYQSLPEVTNFFKLTSDHVNFQKFNLPRLKVQHYLEEHLDELKAEELGIYFKTLLQFQKPIVSVDLKEKLLKRFVAELSTMEWSSSQEFLNFFCFLNAFNRSAAQCTPYVIECANYFAENSDRTTFAHLSHVGLLCCRFLVYHPPLLEILRKSLSECSFIDDLKAIECAVYSLTFFGHPCADAVNPALRERLKSLRFMFHRRVVDVVSWLANVGVYDFELIDSVLSGEFLSSAYGNSLDKLSVQREIFMLDYGVGIECPEYAGSRLRSEVRNQLDDGLFAWAYPSVQLISPTFPFYRKVCYADPYTFGCAADTATAEQETDMFPPPPVHYNGILAEAEALLDARYNGKYSALCYVLHHYPRPNLVLSFDSQHRIRRMQNVSQQGLFNWRVMNKKHKWYAFTVAVRNSTTKDAVPLENEIPKVRQLRKLGFNVISIVQDDWVKMQEEEKRQFLNQCLEA